MERDEQMTLLIGTDEAGYGPNLGPLVVGASVWRTDREGGMIEQGEASPFGDGVSIADSKQLYSSGGGLAALEKGVLGVLTLLGRRVTHWRDIWPAVVAPEDELQPVLDAFPWHAHFDLDLPVNTTFPEMEAAVSSLTAGLVKSATSILALQAAVVFPAAFNAQVARTSSKGEVLSLTTLRLVKQLLDNHPHDNAQVTCDKHGGRDRYAALLQHLFPEALLSIRAEGRAESRYQLVLDQRRVEFRFISKGERILPTALASMLAKYLRELAMIPFNAFWQRHVPGLKATAGYPEDAKRFKAEISLAQQRLGIADDCLWRTR